MENNHKLVLDNQKRLDVSGVAGVDSMSDKEVEIVLAASKIVVRGEGLNVNKLNVDDGNLTVVGDRIYSVVYTDKNKAKAGLSKLFK